VFLTEFTSLYKQFASLRSSGILNSVDWQLRIDVSGQPMYSLVPEYVDR